MKNLPVAIQCPSVGSVGHFDHQDCDHERCPWWEKGCTARTSVEETFGPRMDEESLPADCELAARCRWHIEAIREGKPACAVRRLGMLCEHQGGEWNTFEMVDPEEWD